MGDISVLGIDLAKQTFQVHAADQLGKKIFNRAVKRGKLLELVAGLPTSLIGMEACGGAHFWAREFRKLGHQVRLIAPQFVKPFVKANKTDAADAEAICEAVQRPSMRFVPVKEIWQQDILSAHRIRSRWVAAKVALENEFHGLCAEYGIVLSKTDGKYLAQIAELISPENEAISISLKALFSEMLEELRSLLERIESVNQQLKRLVAGNEDCQRLMQVPGVGVITATALYASVGDPAQFKNGRQFSAWLGLVPKQHSSGGKPLLLGISKRGDAYLRGLLIHGARSVVRYVNRENPCRLNQWVLLKKETRGPNKAAVALANKNARAIWVILRTKQNYRFEYATVAA
jgi:transposase